MLIKELVTRLGFDVDFAPLNKFDDKIGETKEGLQDMGAAADEAVNQVKSALATIRNLLIGFTVATAAGGAALFAIVKSAANTGDEINKLAPLLGFTTEEFQKYRYAAKIAGVENENFAQSVQLLLRNIAEGANGGKEITKSFARLGLNPAQLRGKSTADVLRLVSDGLARIPNEADRVSISMDLLGRSGARMGAFLAKGTGEMDALMADVEAFGMFTADSAQAAEDFNDSLDRVLFFFRGIKNELAQGLFPVFRAMIDDVREWLSLNRESIKAGLAVAIQAITYAATRAWAVVKRVVKGFETLISALGGVKNAFYILGISILSPILLLIGPIVLLTRATFFLLIPFIRLHTLIILVSFAMSALMPIIMLMTSVVAALAATKLIGWLIAAAGGYRALATAILIPTLALIAQAAALALIILLFEDLTTWILGGKSIIGDWVGEWAKVPDKLRAIWQQIKDVFVAGGKFIAAVFRGDFAEAYRLLAAGAEKVKDAFPARSVGAPISAQDAQGFSQGAGGWAVMAPGGGLAGRTSFAGSGAAGTGPTSGPGPQTFLNSFRLGDVLDKSGNSRPAGGGAAVVHQSVSARVEVNLPKGTPQEHAEETARVFKDLMDGQIDHSLQQSVQPGR